MGHLVAGLRPPRHGTGVGEEEDGSDDGVLECPAVAVGVVRDRSPDALGVGGVGDERDRRGVGGERGGPQGQAAPERTEGLADPLTPGQGVTGVVDLVEDDERAPGCGAVVVEDRLRGDLGVSEGDTVESGGVLALGVLEVRVEFDAHARSGVRPLDFEVLGGGNDRDAVDDALGEELSGQAQGEGRLARTGGRDGEEVLRLVPEVEFEGLGLPRAQFAGRSPSGALGEGR